MSARAWLLVQLSLYCSSNFINMNSALTSALATIAHEVSYESLPADVKTVARQALMDWVGVALAGANEDFVHSMVRVLSAQGGAAQCTAIGHPLRLPSVNAALMNGLSSHALDYDDVHFAIPGHASAPVLAAALAVAEEIGASGRELVEAFVAGVEVSCRLGLAMAPKHYALGFHATATIGSFGAAAATAKLLKLTPEQVQSTFGIVATRAAGLKAVFGTSCKPLQAGSAASAGVLAALLTQQGFDSTKDVLDHRLGFPATHGGGDNAAYALGAPLCVSDFSDSPKFAKETDAAFHLQLTLFKYHATCYETHSAIECALKARSRIGEQFDAIRSISVEVNAHCDDICNIQEPRTAFEAKFSIRASVALAFLGVQTGDPAQISTANLYSHAVRELLSRVTVVLCHDVPVPVARMRVEMEDGSCIIEENDSSVPMADLEAQQAKLEKKFFALVDPIIGTAQAEALHRQIRTIDELENVADMMRLLSLEGRS